MTIPHYGKRDPGGLTAGSPGDTLFIPLNFYNDSGASISIGSTLAVSDVEVFKNGGTTERATDSGYAILGDTGNFDDRTGFKGISVQLFNTSDDTGFYDAGSMYWVAIDSVTVDARTVRFWAAIFEIGTPRANVVEVDADTGAAAHLAQMSDEYDTGRLPADAGETLDTGSVNQAVWQADGIRALTDTGNEGVANAVWAQATRILTANTNLAGLAVDVTQLDGDTGQADRLGKFASLLTGSGQIDTGTGLHDTGEVASAVWNFATRAVTDVTGLSDTGLNDRLDKIETDTGVNETIDRILADTDTGAQNANIVSIDGDTGFADRLGKFVSVLSADGQVDTGTLAGTQAGTIDANVTYVNETAVGGTGDTGANDPWGPA